MPSDNNNPNSLYNIGDKPIPDDELVDQDDAVIGKAFRISIKVFAGLALSVAIIYWLTRPDDQAIDNDADATIAAPIEKDRSGEPVIPAVSFVDITADSGINYVHENGSYGMRLLPETMGGGVAFFDYNNDGAADLLFVDSAPWPEHAYQQQRNSGHRLYENNGQGQFVDVTDSAGLSESFYGMGVAVADYDNDGDPDIYLTAVGNNHLYRNDNGRFTDVSAQAGVMGGDNEWSSSATFLDYNNDGWLDLFVANYVEWSQQIDLAVDYRLTGIGRAYGPPTNYAGRHPQLFRNRGDGTFEDVSAVAGVQVVNKATGEPIGKALAVLATDLDLDGLVDILVANDTVQNFFFRNLGDGTFSEDGALWGIAFDRNGHATGAMGIDGGIYRNDNAYAVAIGNFANEMTSLYVTDSNRNQFNDQAIIDGIGPVSRSKLSFGLFFFDYDLDGRLDFLQANGHVENEISRVQSSQRFAQVLQLFWNCGENCGATFRLVEATGAMSNPLVGRGAAYADIDADGDLDFVISQVAGSPMLVRNDQDTGHQWLRIRLQQADFNREAIGARIGISIDSNWQWREMLRSRSYLSSVEAVATFGLGNNNRVDAIQVVWPDGKTEEFLAPTTLNREILLQRTLSH